MTDLKQIYGGYFLILLLMLMFCLVCRLWQRAKINYSFIFEFDLRSHLDWRQLAEVRLSTRFQSVRDLILPQLPCFFAFLLGIIMRLNFQEVGGERMYIYWPVVLIGLTLVVIFLPAPILQSKTRLWMVYSNVGDKVLGHLWNCSREYLLTQHSGDYCVLAYTPSSSATSSWATCSVR